MNRPRGFTLIEVLVALSLTGLLVTVLFAGFRVGVDSWASASRHIDRVEDSRSLISLLSRHLMQLQPVWVVSDEGAEPAFRGTRSTLRYVAPLSLSTGNRLYLVELVSGRDDKPGTWVRFGEWLESGDIEEVFVDAHYQQVSEHTVLRFAYFSEADPRGWVDDYPPDVDAPRLVSVQIRDRRGNWPRLTLATGAR